MLDGELVVFQVTSMGINNGEHNLVSATIIKMNRRRLSSVPDKHGIGP